MEVRYRFREIEDSWGGSAWQMEVPYRLR